MATPSAPPMPEEANSTTTAVAEDEAEETPAAAEAPAPADAAADAANVAGVVSSGLGRKMSTKVITASVNAINVVALQMSRAEPHVKKARLMFQQAYAKVEPYHPEELGASSV